jgi:tetratricopeptide (TPR) repeat protein
MKALQFNCNHDLKQLKLARCWLSGMIVSAIVSIPLGAIAQSTGSYHSNSPMTTTSPTATATSAQSAVENFRSGNITRAVQQWNQEIRAGNNVINNLFNRSQAYILLEQYDSALQDVNTIIALEGSAASAEVLLVQGIALSNLNQLAQAIDSFNQAERRQPSVLVYSNRAIAYQRTGQFQAALADLTTAVELLPTAINRLNLANLHIQMGEFASAVEGMDQLITADASFFPAYLSRGIAHYHLDQHEAAVRDLLYTLTASPSQPDARYYAGLSLEKLNYREEASQNLIMAADLYLQQNRSDSYHQVLDKMAELGL